MSKKVIFTFLLMLILNQLYSINIIDGLGIDNIVLNESTRQDVENEYGDNFTISFRKGTTTEIRYNDLYLSFYYSLNDSDKVITNILIEYPNEGKTTKGIKLGQNTMKDVIDIYGKPTRWTSSGEKTWQIQYNGIIFHILKDENNSVYPAYVNQYIDKKIVAIEVNTKLKPVQTRLKSEKIDKTENYTSYSYPFGFKEMKYTDAMYSLFDIYYGYQLNNKHHFGLDFLTIVGSGRGTKIKDRPLLGLSLSQLNISEEYFNLSFLQFHTGLRLLSVQNSNNSINIYDFLQIKLKPISIGYNLNDKSSEYTPEVIIGNDLVIGLITASIDYRLFILDINRSHFEFKMGFRLGYLGHYITR